MADGSAPLRILQLTVVVVIAALLLLAAVGTSSSKDEYRPDLVLDLHKFGFEKPDKFREQSEYLTLKNSVVFVDDDTLAVSLFVPNPRPGMSVRNKMLCGLYLFQTVLVDAKSGKIIYTHTWSNAGIGCGLFPASNGTFVVLHDLELSLHTLDGTPLKSLSLNPKDFPRTVVVEQSPSGDTLFAIRMDRQGSHALRIRTADLQPLGWMDLPSHYSAALSESNFAFVRATPGALPSGSGWGGPSMQLFVCSIDAQEDLCAEPEPIYATPAPGCGSVVFVDKETLGLSGTCYEIVLLNRTGKVLYRRKFERELTSPIVSCRSCDLIAYGTYILRGGSSWLDTFPKAKRRSTILFNRRTQQLLELPSTVATGYLFSKALSPNGCLLALQSDSHLDVYRICNSPIGARLQEIQTGQ